MAAAKIKVSDVAKKMGKSEKDVIFQLQSLGADITDASQVLEPEVIQAALESGVLPMELGGRAGCAEMTRATLAALPAAIGRAA